MAIMSEIQMQTNQFPLLLPLKSFSTSMSNAKVLQQNQDIQSYTNLGPMVIDDLSADISRGEQQYCNSLQQHNIGGDLIDYELVGCVL